MLVLNGVFYDSKIQTSQDKILKWRSKPRLSWLTPPFQKFQRSMVKDHTFVFLNFGTLPLVDVRLLGSDSAFVRVNLVK